MSIYWGACFSSVWSSNTAPQWGAVWASGNLLFKLDQPLLKELQALRRLKRDGSFSETTVLNIWLLNLWSPCPKYIQSFCEDGNLWVCLSRDAFILSNPVWKSPGPYLPNLPPHKLVPSFFSPPSVLILIYNFACSCLFHTCPPARPQAPRAQGVCLASSSVCPQDLAQCLHVVEGSQSVF